MTTPTDGIHTANPQPVARVWLPSYYNPLTSRMMGFDWVRPGGTEVEAGINFDMGLEDLNVICDAKPARVFPGAILGALGPYAKGFPSRLSDHTVIFTSFHALELVMAARMAEIDPIISRFSKLGYPVEITLDLTGRIIEQSYNPSYSVRKAGS